MRKKRDLKKGNNTKVAIIFVGFVVAIVLISLILKFVVILSQSQFDSSKRFTMILSNKNKIKVISISPVSPQGGPISHSMSVLKFDENIEMPISQFLAIPIDGFVKGESIDIEQKADSLFPKMIFNYKKLDTNLTFIDLIKLFVTVRSLSESDIHKRTISKDLSPNDIDSLAR